MHASTRPLHLGPGEGTEIEGPVGGPITYKVRGDESGGGVTAFEQVIAPQDGPPLHTHGGEDEAFYVIAGRFRFRLGDEVAYADEGSFVFVPRGTPHCFQNTGDGPARILAVFTPSGMERFFDRFAELREVDPEEFARLGREAGMDIIGPPLSDSHPLP